MNDLPTRCIDPAMKDCQNCRYGSIIYGDDVECYADTQGCCFDTICTLGFENDLPTDEEIKRFEEEMRRF